MRTIGTVCPLRCIPVASAEQRKVDPMRLQVLAVTMHRKDWSIAEQMNIRCEAVVANQADRDETVTRDTDYGVWKMITTSTRGVGTNRNVALDAADGDILLLADDDVVYRDDMPERVLTAFAEIASGMLGRLKSSTAARTAATAAIKTGFFFRFAALLT